MTSKPVLIISNYDDIHNPYYGGGGAALTGYVAAHLTPHFQVTVITGKYPGCLDEIKSGVSYRRIGIAFGGPKLGQIVYHLLLPYYALTWRYDLWVESFTPPISTSFLPLFTRRPVVGWVHSLTGQDMTRKYKLPFVLIERLGLRFYRHFLVPTSYLAQKIAGLSPRARLTVIPHGLPRQMVSARATPARHPRHILYVGRLAHFEKGLNLLLSAFARIPSDIRVPLVIAGTGPTSQIRRLKNTIARLGLTSLVKLVGQVPPPKRNQLLKSSYCLAFPSRFETFGLVALEAFSQGVPVVCFDIPGLAWAPRTCALKSPPFAISAFSRHLSRMVDDSSLRLIMGRRAKRFSARFILEELPAKYFAALGRILRSGNISRQPSE